MKNRISYWQLLRKPGFAGLLFAVSFGRLAAGLVPFGLTALLVQGRSYAVAGIVSVVYMVTTSATAPMRGRWIDRYSPRVVLPMLAALSAALTATAFLSIRLSPSGVLCGALICAGGASAPMVSVVLRSIWSEVASDEPTRRALHALDSVLEESIYVVSPLVVTSFWLGGRPAFGILLGALCTPISVVFLFLFSKRAGPRTAAVLTQRRQLNTSAGARASGAGALFLSARGLALMLPMFGFAACIGYSSIAFAAWCADYHTTALTGILAALSSVGGLVGGIVYGKVDIADYTASRLYLLMPAFVAIVSWPMALSGSFPVGAFVACAIGIVMTPMFIAAYVRVPLDFPSTRLNEANASVGMSYNLGSALGSLFAGCCVGRISIASLMLLMSLIPLLSAVAGLLIDARKPRLDGALGADLPAVR